MTNELRGVEAATDLLKQKIAEAFDAGFQESSEGYNYEYCPEAMSEGEFSASRSHFAATAAAAYLEATTPVLAGAGKVKLLEWAKVGFAFEAKTILGVYRVDQCAEKARLYSLDRSSNEWFNSPDEAKAAAQVDYEQRILSTLVHPKAGDNAEVEPLSIPVGWKLVPSEPTEEMTERGASSTCSLTIHGARGVYLAMLAQSPEHRGTDMEDAIASVVQSVNEWDDRTSPDDYPEHLLITSEELADILRNFAASIPTKEDPKGVDGEVELIEALLLSLDRSEIANIVGRANAPADPLALADQIVTYVLEKARSGDKEQRSLMEERIGQLEDELYEAQQEPWPDWARSILKALKANGYDPVDADGTVDLGEAFADYLEGISVSEDGLRRIIAEKNAEISRLRAALRKEGGE